MSREYLFRGKTKQGEWVYWDMFARATKNIDNTQSLNYDTYVVFYDDEQTPTFVIKREIGGFEYLDILPETIGEYVGLKDKNGKKIFEGDIMPVWEDGEKYLYKVVYCGDCFMLAMLDSEQGSYPLSIKHSISEVIGNVHDNKELLGE